MWPNSADLVTFTEEILNEKLHFLCSDKHIFILMVVALPVATLEDKYMFRTNERSTTTSYKTYSKKINS